MEAAGIEPASRDASVSASTCVVDSLSFAGPSPVDRVRYRLDENRVLTQSVLDMTLSDPDLATGFWDSPAKSRNRGYRLLGSQCEVTFGT